MNEGGMAALVFLFDNIIFPVICAFATPSPKQALAQRAGVLFASDLISGSSGIPEIFRLCPSNSQQSPRLLAAGAPSMN